MNPGLSSTLVAFAMVSSLSLLVGTLVGGTQEPARYPAPGPVGDGRSRTRTGCDGASGPDGAAQARRPAGPDR